MERFGGIKLEKMPDQFPSHEEAPRAVLGYLAALLGFLERLEGAWLRLLQPADKVLGREDRTFVQFFAQLYQRPFAGLPRLWLQVARRLNPLLLFPLLAALRALGRSRREGLASLPAPFEGVRAPQMSGFVAQLLGAGEVETEDELRRLVEGQRVALETLAPGNTRYAGVLEATRRWAGLLGYVGRVGGAEGVEGVEALVGLLAGWLEKAAASRPKYRDLVLLENYGFLAARTGLGELERRAAHHRARYLRWHMEYQLGSFCGFLGRLKALLKQVRAEELPFQQGFRREVFEKEVRVSFAKFEPTFTKMAARLAKHLRHDEPLLGSLLRGLRDLVVQEYQRVELVAERCYGIAHFQPSLQEVSMAMLVSPFARYFKEAPASAHSHAHAHADPRRKDSTRPPAAP